jgi:hypothetical protein
MKHDIIAVSHGTAYIHHMKVSLDRLDALGYDGVNYRQKLVDKFLKKTGYKTSVFPPPETIFIKNGSKIIRTLVEGIDYQ